MTLPAVPRVSFSTGRPDRAVRRTRRLSHTRTVKKSQAVQLTIVASVAVAALGACREREQAQRCVNQQTNEVVADSLCGPEAQERARSSGVGVLPFLWYFGGGVRGGGVNGIGGRVAGGQYASPSLSQPGNTRARGGFGSSARGRAVYS
jgi:hypothetical protein